MRQAKTEKPNGDPGNRRERRRATRLAAGAFALLGTALLCPPGGDAAFFKYTDRQGRIHYVDELWKVPPEYRGQVARFVEKHDHLPAGERAQAAAEEEQRRSELEVDRQRKAESILRELNDREAAERRERAERERLRALAAMESRVEIVNNQILVPATFIHQGREVATRLLLDTGASHTVLHRATVAPLNLIRLGKGKSTVAGGHTVATELGKLDCMRVGPIEVREVHVTVIAFEGTPPPYGGLLGMDFLSQVEYTIDYANQVVRWKLRE